MLIITRKPGDRVLVGDNIRIEVMEVSGNSVRLGISAPSDVPVYREELWEAVRKENEAAASDRRTELPDPRGG